MSDNKKTTMHVSQEPKKDGCCGGTHAKDQKAQVAKTGKDPSDDHKHENMPKSDGGSGCCGGSKATK